MELNNFLLKNCTVLAQFSNIVIMIFPSSDNSHLWNSFGANIFYGQWEERSKGGS